MVTGLVVWALVLMAFLGFNLYVADLVHKMKEDMRLVKIRTGKIIQLLDSVISNSKPTNVTTDENKMGTEDFTDHPFQEENVPTTLTALVPTSNDAANTSLAPPQLFKTLTSFMAAPLSAAGLALPGSSSSFKEPVAQEEEKIADDDEAINTILTRLKHTIPKTVAWS
jgi:hypothetical protein